MYFRCCYGFECMWILFFFFPLKGLCCGPLSRSPSSSSVHPSSLWLHQHHLTFLFLFLPAPSHGTSQDASVWGGAAAAAAASYADGWGGQEVVFSVGHVALTVRLSPPGDVRQAEQHHRWRQRLQTVRHGDTVLLQEGRDHRWEGDPCSRYILSVESRWPFVDLFVPTNRPLTRHVPVTSNSLCPKRTFAKTTNQSSSLQFLTVCPVFKFCIFILVHVSLILTLMGISFL